MNFRIENVLSFYYNLQFIGFVILINRIQLIDQKNRLRYGTVSVISFTGQYYFFVMPI